jgi:septum formation protein
MARSLDPTLVLASGSPRRSALLEKAGIAFEVLPADIPEELRTNEAPSDFARRLAAEKAQAVAGRLALRPERLVLGADTIVVIDGAVLGKPTDPRDADRLLRRLLGQTHVVITAVAIVDRAARRVWQVQVESAVSMRAASDAERAAYVATGEGLDKAGAYAVQGEGRRFIERIAGSETNVIGLPVAETLELLRSARECAS